VVRVGGRLLCSWPRCCLARGADGARGHRRPADLWPWSWRLALVWAGCAAPLSLAPRPRRTGDRRPARPKSWCWCSVFVFSPWLFRVFPQARYSGLWGYRDRQLSHGSLGCALLKSAGARPSEKGRRDRKARRERGSMLFSLGLLRRIGLGNFLRYGKLIVLPLSRSTRPSAQQAGARGRDGADLNPVVDVPLRLAGLWRDGRRGPDRARVVCSSRRRPKTWSSSTKSGIALGTSNLRTRTCGAAVRGWRGRLNELR